MDIKQAPPHQMHLSSDDSEEFSQYDDPPVLDTTIMGNNDKGAGPSTRGRQSTSSRHGKNGGHNPSKSKISNSELMFAMRSIDARLKKLEDTIGDIVRMMHIMQQSNPTFLSAGRSGRLIKTDGTGNKTVIQDPI